MEAMSDHFSVGLALTNYHIQLHTLGAEDQEYFERVKTRHRDIARAQIETRRGALQEYSECRCTRINIRFHNTQHDERDDTLRY